MVSDQDLAKGVETLLRQSDPSSLTSLTSVVQQLEAKLGLDLTEKTTFIRDQINILLRAHQNPSASVASASSVQQSQPPLSSQQNLHSGVNVPVAKGHFTLSHPSQFSVSQSQQYPPHFALQPPYHSYDLNFRQPYPVYMPPQQHQHQQQSPRQQSSVMFSQGANQAPKESAPAGTKRKGGPGGLNKVCRVSPELQVVVGEPALPRTEIVRQLWAYIRKNNLQDPSNKRKIICDDALRVVFETDCTDMFKMNKLLAKHILPLDPSKDSGQAKKAKAEVETKTETTEPVNSTAVSSTVALSEPLAKFFGTGEAEMTDEEIIRRVWEYIKLNNLEDPVNPMAIQCDEKLRDLLGCESISAVGINEMLRRHMYKQS
ncbi:DEK C-terminal [Arabidopsis suecica]|uniref:DEK C-terminal n=1 Tax=Arabidopsis suecica TaxID=45249 RepID=A0A8T1YKB6_ARASU|nr:DEK C-terminal [Arabidopsis suecica]